MFFSGTLLEMNVLRFSVSAAFYSDLVNIVSLIPIMKTYEGHTPS